MKKDKEKEELNKQIISLKLKIKNLEKDLIHDSLTCLKTRVFFEEQLDENLNEIFAKNKHNRKEESGFTKISVLFIDLDNFKKVNDVYGHDVGDMVLKTVANILKKNVRGTDIAARYGGEEFTISFLGASEKDSYNKAEKIREIINKTVFKDYPDLRISASIGVASAKNSSRVGLVKSADIAMYKAKSLGKNMVIKYLEIKNE